MNEKSVELVDEAQTIVFGQQVAKILQPGQVLYLQGDLGAGKTTFCRGVLQFFGHQGAVKSPTYTLVEPYSFADLTIYHFDLYRLMDPEELEFMGIRDYFNQTSIALIEWPEKGEGFIPEADFVLSLAFEDQGRLAKLFTREPIKFDEL